MRRTASAIGSALDERRGIDCVPPRTRLLINNTTFIDIRQAIYRISIICSANGAFADSVGPMLGRRSATSVVRLAPRGRCSRRQRNTLCEGWQHQRWLLEYSRGL